MDTSGKKNSWRDRRTKIEKCLLVVTAFALLVIIYLASNLLMKFPTTEKHEQKVCMTEKCIRSAASILENMDRTVDPCDDFYKFACGNFVKNTIIPGDKMAVSTSFGAGDQTYLQFMEVFEEPIRDKDPKSLKLMKTMYKSCMNTTRIEKEGLQYVKKTFRELGGWPVIDHNYWNEKYFDWKDLMLRLGTMGWRSTFFFSMYIDTDTKNSSKRIFTISQTSMPYARLQRGLNDSAVKASYEFLINLATLFGADKTHATVEMKEVIDFEIEVSKIMIPYTERSNITLEYNPVTIRELQRNISSIPWLQIINNYLSPIDRLTSDDIVNVALPKYLDKLEDLLLKTKKRTLANYMFSRLVRDSVKHLPEVFRKAELEYFKAVDGQNEVTPRWKQCVYEANRLHIAASSIYVKRFFDHEIKKQVEELVSDIKGSFLETLRKIGWMDRKTKRYAIIKAEKMLSFIAFRDEILDDIKVEEHYEGLEISPDEYQLKTRINLSNFFHKKYVKKLREPVVTPDWKSHADTFSKSAFYDQSENAIDLPAAILQDRFFDPKRPQYMNYGVIGNVIGHEITHGFDYHGKQYDKDGNLVDWWEPETNRTFCRKIQCLVGQYGNYTIPDIEMNVNGGKTLSENIADNGGIKIAYRGYLKWLERNQPELPLPGLPYTPRQMFWIAAANNMCLKYKKEALKQQVILGFYAPAYFRVVIPFMNSDYFGKDFSCPLGSPMNPKYKCTVW